jgi:hypothetical protein
MLVNFTPIEISLANKLIEFISRKNLGKTIIIDNKKYKLEFISHNSNSFFKTRRLSVYFKVDKSIIRISDHWVKSVGNNKSHKLNCHSISGKNWIINKKTERIYCTWNCGRYPWVMLAGKAGLSKLNKSCDHFRI